MKVKNLLLAVLAFGAANILMACNTDRPSDSSPSVPTHTHSWNSDWEHDDSNHWHICTDSECEEIDSKSAHAWDEGTVTKEAKPEEAGVMTYKCTVCELTKTEAINPTGHTYGELVEVVEATCEEVGYAAHYRCSCCEEYFTEGKEKTTLEELTVAVKGHAYGELVAAKAATCEEAGLAAYYHCSDCDTYFTEGKEKTTLAELAVAVKGHAYGELVAAKAATCEEAGLAAYYHCSDCDTYFTEGKEKTTLAELAVAVKGHAYGELVAAKAATGEEAGHAAYYHCSDCDTYFTEGKEKTTLAALTEASKGHDYVHQSYTKIDGVWYSHQVCIGDSAHSQNVVTDMIKVEVNELGFEKLSEAVAAAANGAEILLIGDVEEASAIVVSKDLTIKLNGKTIIVPTDNVGDGVFKVTSGTLTINGEGTINSVGNNNNNTAIFVNGGKVVINGGTYTNVGATTNDELGQLNLVLVRTGELEINGGRFISQNPQYTISVHETDGGTVVIKAGTFYKYSPAAEFLAAGYQAVAYGDNYVIKQKEMVADFTFENGLANSVENSNVIGYLFSNATDTRGQVVDTDPSTRISTTHTVGSTSYNLGSNAILSAHSSANPSFGVSGFDMGSGDFTISLKHYMPSDFIKSVYSDKNNQWCVMSVNSEANSTNKLFIYLGKDSKDAGYFRPIVNLNGTKVNLFTYNVSGYYSGRKWTEYRVVKQGTKVTVTIIPASAETNAKCIAYSVEFTLESADDFTLTPEQVIGFGNNYGSTRPGNDSYYDDIKVWNYAVDFE